MYETYKGIESTKLSPMVDSKICLFDSQKNNDRPKEYGCGILKEYQCDTRRGPHI